MVAINPPGWCLRILIDPRGDVTVSHDGVVILSNILVLWGVSNVITPNRDSDLRHIVTALKYDAPKH